MQGRHKDCGDSQEEGQPCPAGHKRDTLQRHKRCRDSQEERQQWCKSQTSRRGREREPRSSERGSLAIRVAGEAGEGIKKPGELLIQAHTRRLPGADRFHPPSEIKGGGFRFSSCAWAPARCSRATRRTSCSASNQEAYEVNIQELEPGGLLIYDPGAVIPSDRDKGQFQLLAFPVEQIAPKI